MTTAHACASVSADSINFIDKDDRRGILFCLIKEIANTGRTDTYIHFKEI